MMIVSVSFARLDGGLPNDLAGSANDMAIWLAARSIRGAQRQLPHCGV